MDYDFFWEKNIFTETERKASSPEELGFCKSLSWKVPFCWLKCYFWHSFLQVREWVGAPEPWSIEGLLLNGSPSYWRVSEALLGSQRLHCPWCGQSTSQDLGFSRLKSPGQCRKQPMLKFCEVNNSPPGALTAKVMEELDKVTLLLEMLCELSLMEFVHIPWFNFILWGPPAPSPPSVFWEFGSTLVHPIRAQNISEENTRNLIYILLFRQRQGNSGHSGRQKYKSPLSLKLGSILRLVQSLNQSVFQRGSSVSVFELFH